MTRVTGVRSGRSDASTALPAVPIRRRSSRESTCAVARAEDVDGPGGRPELEPDRGQQRRLSGPVRAEHDPALTGTDRPVERTEDRPPGTPDDETPNLDDRRRLVRIASVGVRVRQRPVSWPARPRRGRRRRGHLGRRRPGSPRASASGSPRRRRLLGRWRLARRGSTTAPPTATPPGSRAGRGVPPAPSPPASGSRTTGSRRSASGVGTGKQVGDRARLAALAGDQGTPRRAVRVEAAVGRSRRSGSGPGRRRRRVRVRRVAASRGRPSSSRRSSSRR